MFAVNEFEDVKFTDELVFEVNEISPNVKFPPCAKVGLVPEQTIDELAAFKVKFVKVPMPTTVPAVNVTVLEPSVIVLTLELVDAKVPAVTAKLAVLNVPFVTVSAFDPMFNASAS